MVSSIPLVRYTPDQVRGAGNVVGLSAAGHFDQLAVPLKPLRHLRASGEVGDGLMQCYRL